MRTMGKAGKIATPKVSGSIPGQGVSRRQLIDVSFTHISLPQISRWKIIKMCFKRIKQLSIHCPKIQMTIRQRNETIKKRHLKILELKMTVTCANRTRSGFFPKQGVRCSSRPCPWRTSFPHLCHHAIHYDQSCKRPGARLSHNGSHPHHHMATPGRGQLRESQGRDVACGRRIFCYRL